MSDHVKSAEAYIFYTVLAAHHGGDCHSSVHTAQNALADVTNGNGNRVESSSLSGNDSAAGFSHILLDLLVVELGTFHAGSAYNRMAVFDGNIGNIGNRPGHKGGVAVLAENIGVYIALADVVILGQSGAQTRRVKDGAGADYAVFGDARQLVERAMSESCSTVYLPGSSRRMKCVGLPSCSK